MAFYPPKWQNITPFPGSFSGRTANNLPIHLSSQSRHLPMPLELEGLITSAEWTERRNKLLSVLQRWYWSILFKLYLIIASIMSFILVRNVHLRKTTKSHICLIALTSDLSN